MKQVLRFETNAPARVALRFEDGKPVEGRFGPQIMYSLADERVMYVPPIVEQRIRELAIAAGEPFEIAKQEIRSGNRKWIEWRVSRIAAEEAAATNGHGARPEVVAGAAPRQGASGNGRAAPGGGNAAAEDGPGAAHARSLAAVPELITGIGMHAMEVALNSAAETAQRIEAQAAARNYALRFTSEDVRAIGLTIFIQLMREAGARWQA